MKQNKQPEKTAYFRWIVELSCMPNNDEYVIHSAQQTNYTEFEKVKQRIFNITPLFDPYLVICRPVFLEEIKAELNTRFQGHDYNEKAPEITKTLDALYKLLEAVKGRMEFFGEEHRNVTSILGDIIAQQFYDCMSSGMPIPALIACRILIKKYKCDLTTEVYPRADRTWNTLADFMEETKGFSDEEKKLTPYIANLLLAHTPQ